MLGSAHCHQQSNGQIPGSQTLPVTAAAMSTERAKGGASAMSSQQATTANPLAPSSQAADQQFSSSPAQQYVEQNNQPQIVIRHRAPPVVPPKPQLDIVRYSMANAKDDIDLDTILNELLELENQLSGDGADQLLNGITPLASSSSHQISSNANKKTIEQNVSNPAHQNVDGLTVYRHRRNIVADPANRVNFVNTVDICASPDIDSAYGDSDSSGRNRNRNSEISSAESYGGSLNTPSPTNQGSPKSADSSSGSTNELQNHAVKLTDAEIKSAKIREALEKMKEAKMKKIYIKFFLEDNLEKGMLVDERWTVAETMQKLANKLGILLTPEHAIVEEYPELHIRRIYEDHEFLVENIEDWLADSKNKLYFIRRNDKYCFIHSPQHYLLTEKVRFEFPEENAEWTPQQKSELLQKYFDNENIVPELEGYLMLKADGRKSWKKHYFVLRSSGLYYSPKGKMRGTKDLQCLMNVYNNQVYTCTDWSKKYKAPSKFGFAIKHPKIQVKTSKFIKYICTDDEKSFRKWITALRLVKNGCVGLEKNFRATFDEMQKTAISKPIHVDTQQIHQRIPVVELTSSSSNSFPTARPQSASAQSVNSSRVSVLSRQTQNGHPNTAFDQDDCGTIKRQPTTDPLNNSLSTSTFNSNAYAQSISHSPVMTSNNSSIHSVSSRQGITTAEVHIENNSKSVNNGELDSDEEQFPPPPEVTAYMHVNKNAKPSTTQPIYQNRPQLIQFRNGFQTPKPLPLAPKPPNSVRSTNKIAPPPPKRSDNTRLQSPSLINEQHKEQMKLFEELQYKIQVRHNQQIDTN